jgi:hypothetical protein
MFFGFESRPEFLPADVKVRREVKRVCTRNKKCRGSMSAQSVINLFIAGHLKDISGIQIEQESLGKEVFIYWDNSVDYGIEEYKCTTEYNGHTYAWYEDKK